MQKSMPKARIFGFLLIAAVSMAAVEHPTSRGQLRKRKPIIPLPPEPPYRPIFNWEQREYLKAHNDLRQQVGVPPVVWDANLTAAAHAWAVQRRGDCNYRQHSSNQYGENIYWKNYKEFTPTDVVLYWFDEYKNYDHEKFECRCQPERAGCECGHYLNLVWSTTRRIGCSGAIYCDHQRGVYVVCDYDPAGLSPGINPFNGSKLHEEEEEEEEETDAGLFNGSKLHEEEEEEEVGEEEEAEAGGVNPSNGSKLHEEEEEEEAESSFL